MENTNKTEWNSGSNVVSAVYFDALADVIQGNFPLPTPWPDDMSNDIWSPIIPHFVQQDESDYEDRQASCSIERLCTSFFQEHDELQLFDMTLCQIEMYTIFKAVVSCNYNCSQAARKLGIGDTTLYNKIEMYKRCLRNQQ